MRDETDHLSREDLQATVDLVDAGISHLSLERRVVWANRFYCDFLGYTLDELRALDVRETTHPDDCSLQAANIQRLMDSERSSITWDNRFLRKDGRAVWGRITASLRRDASGCPLYFVAVTTDIDALRAAELEVRKARRQLEDAEAIAAFGSWERDLVHRTLTWSPGGFLMFGLDPAGQPLTFDLFMSMVHPEDRPKLQALLQRAMRDAIDFETEYRILRRDGAERVVHVRGRMFKDAAGQTARSIGTMQDVTERRRQEATIREQQQALVHSEALAAIGSLTASVAHEINNPLAWASLNLENAMIHPDEVPQRLAESLDGVRRAAAIVRTLKGLSGVQGSEQHAVELEGPLESALAMALNELHQKATVVRDFAAVPPVLGDDVRLAQVFLNLLVNAGHALDGRGPGVNEVCVTVRHAGDQVSVAIRDTGCGIAPEHLGRIFEPFFSTRSRAKGTGLGLPISRRIVEDFGGRIEVVSAPGQGSTFTVWLRAVPHAARTPPPQAIAVEQPTARVLVVDDERLIRRAVVRALPKCSVVEADSGDSARKLLERDVAFDAVLCDMMMPGLSGMELHEWLTARAPELAARMVFITGGAFTPAARAFLERPDVRCLEKPFDAKHLVGCVAAASRRA